jgi:hypothetical protein
MLSVGAFVEGDLYLSWMHFPSPFLPLFFFLLYSFICFFFFFFFFIQGLTKGHYLGMVTRDDSVTHKYFHRDEKVGS